ncbi:MAG: putative zinc-binding metallopeptidase [Planctomycetota bacterium]
MTVRKMPARPSSRWQRLGEAELLRVRIRALGLALKGSPLESSLERVSAELAGRHLRVRPGFYLSDEWFTVNGQLNVAVPFFLAHPRLKRLEEKMLLTVEGGTEVERMRILRHEAGHVVDHAFRLSRRRRYREVFGRSRPYPRAYSPKQDSKRFVQHLPNSYAQSHPAEDFAETFAVWLRPRSSWRSRYRDWRVALAKLEFVNDLMKELAGKRPPVSARERYRPLSSLAGTLGDFYRRRQDELALEFPRLQDRDLLRLFVAPLQGKALPRASTLLRRYRDQVVGAVARTTGMHRYSVDRRFRQVVERCRELDLRAPRRGARPALEMAALLANSVVRYARRGEFFL